MTDNVLARVVALKTTPIAELKQLWRDLFNTEPPPYNRRFLENRLAYRLQELARWRDALGIPIQIHPKHFPHNELPAARKGCTQSYGRIVVACQNGRSWASSGGCGKDSGARSSSAQGISSAASVV